MSGASVLKGQTMLVTGAARGIGEAVARQAGGPPAAPGSSSPGWSAGTVVADHVDQL